MYKRQIFNILFQLKNSSAVTLTITDEGGKVVLKEDLSDQTAVGFNSIEKKFKPFKIGGVYFVTLTTKDTSATQKIIVKE